MNAKDWFGLQNLGNQQHNILLEEKCRNASVKKNALKSLKKSVEECVMKKRQVDFKIALDDAFQAFEQIPLHKIRHRD